MNQDHPAPRPEDPHDGSLHVFWHEDCHKHDTGEGIFEAPRCELLQFQEPHPENIRRILNIKSILERGPLAARLRWHPGRHASISELRGFHDALYIDSIVDAERSGPRRLDGAGTIAGPGTWEAALAAAGTGIVATDHVLDGHGSKAYALVRPPGHHAQPAMADGSCIFNNLGIAARHALARGVRKIAIIDWDQHHGNGTQEGFYRDQRVLTVSIHMPHGRWGTNHPQVGGLDEIGEGDGTGYNLNVPAPFGAGDQCYKDVVQRIVGPVIDEFAPDLLFVACGQDANQFDPNGRGLLTMAGFRMLGDAVRVWADRHAAGRVVMFQEGGYAITYTAFCAYATIEGLLGAVTGMADPAAYYDQSQAQILPDVDGILNRWRSMVAEARRTRCR